MNRADTITHYQQNPDVDVLIIGAGINGSATFRDLALQKINVLIVDRDDMCSGASAASSHMVHGGIRYLENGEFRLVKEAVAERNYLLKNAPHYVHPLPTTIPIFKLTSGLFNAPLKFAGLLSSPSERGALVIKAGLMMYDAYTGKKGDLPRHDFNRRSPSLAKFPDMNPKLLATATYYDAAMFTPERLCLELLLDGTKAHENAHFLNYMPAIQAHEDTVTLRDKLSDTEITIRPKLVINAAGPWIDFANQKLGKPTRWLGGTKGSHIVVEHPQLRAALQDNEIFFENKDGRIVLLYPLKDKVLIGTSDIHIENPDDARCTDEEIAYFINLVNIVFPKISLTPDQIIFRFSGVRPLPANDSDRPGQISRDHSLKELSMETTGLQFPIYALIGGKWTTFRAFASKVTNHTLAYLSHKRRTSTRNLPIGGGHQYPISPTSYDIWFERQQKATGLPLPRIKELFERYGTYAEQIAAYITTAADTPLHHHPDYSQREIAFLVEHEQVIHIDDILLRRSLMGMLGQITPELINEIADIIAPLLHWNPSQQQAEIERTLTLLADKHALTFPT